MPDNGRMDPQGFSENSRLRASDADRDQAATVLNNAMAEGRLTVDEHSERLDAVYAAKTHADIVPLLDDLPGHGTALAPVSRPGAAGPVGAGEPHHGHPERRDQEGGLARRAGHGHRHGAGRRRT